MRATRHHTPATGNVAGENRRSALPDELDVGIAFAPVHSPELEAILY